MRRWIAAACTVLLAAAGRAASPNAPQPVAPKIPSTDDDFGTRLLDHNRGMETRASHRFVAWLKAEDAHARAVLAAIPGSDALRARIAVDATQHVRPGSSYPAVLLTTSDNDPPIAPFQPGGMGSIRSQRERGFVEQFAFLHWQIGRPGYQPASAGRAR